MKLLPPSQPPASVEIIVFDLTTAEIREESDTVQCALRMDPSFHPQDQQSVFDGEVHDWSDIIRLMTGEV
jgi:uncharacterized protein YbaA (DUF1428 family)